MACSRATLNRFARGNECQGRHGCESQGQQKSSVQGSPFGISESWQSTLAVLHFRREDRGAFWGAMPVEV